MKRLALVSVAVAALLLSGCEKKETQTTSAPAAQEAVKAEASKAEAPKAEAKPVAEAPKPAQTEAKPAEASEAKAASEQKPANVTEQAQEAANNAKEAAKEKVTEVVDKAKEAANAAAAAAVGASAPAASASAKASAGDKGKELYAKCASCHGAKGDQKALGKSAVIAGMAKDELVKKMQEYKAGTLNQYGMGALMKGQVASLSDADIEALADYISNLK